MTEEQVFLAVLELADPADRTAYLEKACGGDIEFRRQVEDLLAAHFKSGEFLDEPVGKQTGAGAATPINENTVSVRANLGGDAVADEKKPDEEPDDLHFLQPSTRPDSLGRIGHYEVLQVLGKGGFGIVFRAFDDVLQRVVALKVLAPAIAATSPARKRFLREARSSAKVRHENVVQVYAVEEQPLPYLVMEFIPGETLQQRLDRTGPLDAPEVLQIGRQIAEGLAAAHATGLIHRDIKPSNILIECGPQQRVRITDFGLARAADDASLTRSGMVAGTPMYMAPEQAKGESLDHRTDLFSLGSVLYIMASGRPPFRASTTFAVLKRVVDDDPRPIREVIPEVPKWLCDIIAKLHAKKPEDRFQSAREVADILADCEAQLKADAKLKDFSRIPLSKPAAGGSGRWKWVAAAALLLPVLALAVTESAGITHLFRDRESTPIAKLDTPKKDDPPAKVEDPPKKDDALAKVVDPPKKGDPPAKVDPPKDTPPWIVLKPIEMKSEGGATLTLQDDGSILAGGNHPPQDVYTLTFRGLPTRIQALRLEVLPHGTLPQNGPGRHESGEFVLTTIKAQLDPPTKTGEPRILKLAKAWADNSRGDDSRVHFAIDADDNTGWVTEVGKPHFAVLELEEPVAATDGTVLRVTLEFKHQGAHLQLGCFRLSVAKDKGVGEQTNDTDRRAAEYVLSIGGIVQVNEQDRDLDKVTELPPEPFRLTAVNLNHNKQVSDAGLANFKDCKNLTQLYLAGIQVTDAGLAHFKDCKNLTLLNLAHTQQVSGAGLAHLKDCKNLTHLWLNETQVSDAGLAHVKDCKNLTFLTLHLSMQVSDTGLAHLKDCKNLTELQLGQIKVTAARIDDLKKALPKCKILWDGGVIEPR